ncbi:MAG: PLP-dependent aminotransferase family protein [Candidatus Eisenbacteria bacterium]|jgi:DNA-binding transcriptional MocR family regulator|nr:PLP-dependent aminotransferase family protein [Candidatus Eisenbacteria bacterium]
MLSVAERLAARARHLAPSPIRELMPYLSLPGMISLGGGYPNPETFAFLRMDVTFRSGREIAITGARMARAAQYGPTPAHKELGQAILKWQQYKDGVTLTDDQLVVLNGSQEGIFIAAYLFLDEADWIVAAEPLYPGTASAVGAFCRAIRTVSIDGDGLRIDELAALLEEARTRGEAPPKFVYDVPSGHNPAGTTLSLQRRMQLLDLARRHDFLIIEDDPYQLVSLEGGQRLPTLQALEGNPERVIRLDSFSKIFAPGLRVGYATGSSAIMRQFVLFKQCANLHTSMTAQEMLAAFIESHGFDGFMRLIEDNCRFYRANRDAMVEAAREHLPGDVAFNVPRHGMFMWFELPTGFDADRMIRSDAEDLMVLLVPGSAFAVSRSLAHCMRASFSMVSPGEITEGMRRFATMIERERERCSAK